MNAVYQTFAFGYNHLLHTLYSSTFSESGIATGNETGSNFTDSISISSG